MKIFLTINYSVIFSGPRPQIADLLEGIDSDMIILLLAIVNSELSNEDDIQEVQDRLIYWMLEGFPPNEKHLFSRRWGNFKKEQNQGPVIFWAKPYVLEMMSFVFKHYNEGEVDFKSFRGGELVRVIKAYLLTIDQVDINYNEQYRTIPPGLIKEDPYYFEKRFWPETVKHLAKNNKVNILMEMYKLFGFINYNSTNTKFRQYWDTFLKLNGFSSLGQYIRSVISLGKITVEWKPEMDFKVFSLIPSRANSPYLDFLSFNRLEFLNDSKKQIDYLGFKERPLYKFRSGEYAVLDLDFLGNKIYNGLLFDLHREGAKVNDPSMASFPDFKGQISREVSEPIIFQRCILKLFQGKHVHLEFDKGKKEGYPDCYIRLGKKIFLFEFKDYTFPGALVDSPSFESLKTHFDTKFIRTATRQSKGITQLKQHIDQIAKGGFEFDRLSRGRLTVYPIIVHADIMYQLPGLNNYLSRALNSILPRSNGEQQIQIKPLVLIELDILLEFLFIKGMNIGKLEKYLQRYLNIVDRRRRRAKDRTNFEQQLLAGAGFGEIFSMLIRPGEPSYSVSELINRIFDGLGISKDQFEKL